MKPSNVFQVRNSYDFHLNEIFATVQNEYSDWSSDNSDFIREVVLADSTPPKKYNVHVDPDLARLEQERRSKTKIFLTVFVKLPTIPEPLGRGWSSL